MTEDLIKRDLKPGETPETAFIGKTWMRRLVHFEYPCQLCGGRHVAENYVSLEVDNMDEFAARIKKLAENSETTSKMFDGTSRLFHQQKGDFKKLIRRAEKNGLYQTTERTKATLTAEADYTCDDCGRTFDTVALLRAHRPGCG